MPTYYIDTLIAFFLSQQKCNYETIELIIAMLEMDEDEFEPDDRWDSIMFALRRAGLNETTHKGGRFFPRDGKYTVNTEPGLHYYDNSRYTEVFIVEDKTLNVLNCQVQMEFPLN